MAVELSFNSSQYIVYCRWGMVIDLMTITNEAVSSKA